jgi:hypothetical protein
LDEALIHIVDDDEGLWDARLLADGEPSARAHSSPPQVLEALQLAAASWPRCGCEAWPAWTCCDD